MQLTELLPNASGVRELEDFRCYMSGDAHTRVDLVQSFEVRTLSGHSLPDLSPKLGCEEPPLCGALPRWCVSAACVLAPMST